MNLSRRGFLAGLAATIAAPAIVKAEILMPIKKIIMPNELGWLPAQVVYFNVPEMPAIGDIYVDITGNTRRYVYNTTGWVMDAEL